MSAPILNQPWEDVADDVTSAIEKAVQPLLRKAVDDIYGGLLDATQDYLKDNLAFNIATRIDTAEREAATARKINAELLEALVELSDAVSLRALRGRDHVPSMRGEQEALQGARAAIAKARGLDTLTRATSALNDETNEMVTLSGQKLA